MKYTLISIILLLNLSYAQEFDKGMEFRHSFYLGYAQTPNELFGIGSSTLSNFSYSFKHKGLGLRITYFHTESIKPNREFDRTENNLFVPQIGFDDKYFGFSLGLMFINNLKGDAPDMFALPVASIKIGFISDYYISASFLDEQSIPSLSLNLNYIFLHPLSFIKIGTLYYDDWSYNSEVQYSFFNFLLIRLRGIYNLKKDRGFYYSGLGFYSVF